MENYGRIKINGFRRLNNIDLEMRPLMVLIGANGVGKTSFLDVFRLLSASVKKELKKQISDFGGLTEILPPDTIGFEIGIAYDFEHTGDVLYKLNISQKRGLYLIEKEELTKKEEKGLPLKIIESDGWNSKYQQSWDYSIIDNPTWYRDNYETIFSQIPDSIDLFTFRLMLASLNYYHLMDVGPRAPVRMPQPMRPVELPGFNGEDLASCLYYISQKDRDTFETIEDTLKAAFPDFERMEFPPVAAGVITMTWRSKNFKNPFYAHQLSEGILRFLWLVTVLQTCDLITLIDEPEVSLHPELLSMLADLLREASMKSQIIVATHSDSLIRFLKPEEIVVMDMNEDGTASMTWGDTLDLDKWLDDYSLDQVWHMGRMGGRS